MAKAGAVVRDVRVSRDHRGNPAARHSTTDLVGQDQSVGPRRKCNTVRPCRWLGRCGNGLVGTVARPSGVSFGVRWKGQSSEEAGHGATEVPSGAAEVRDRPGGTAVAGDVLPHRDRLRHPAMVTDRDLVVGGCACRRAGDLRIRQPDRMVGTTVLQATIAVGVRSQARNGCGGPRHRWASGHRPRTVALASSTHTVAAAVDLRCGKCLGPRLHPARSRRDEFRVLAGPCRRTAGRLDPHGRVRVAADADPLLPEGVELCATGTGRRWGDCAISARSRRCRSRVQPCHRRWDV